VSTGASQQLHGLTTHQIYERTAPGVVFINATGVNAPRSTREIFRGEDGEQGTATGSGFEIDQRGTILTNWHVIEGATKVTIAVDGRTTAATVLGDDPSDDLAILRISTNGLTLHPLTLGDSSTAQVGDPVFAIGNPFGLAQTLTTGVISALERRITAPNGVTIDGALQTDAPINPGNSGGPLLNEQGEVIGINSQIETSGERAGSVGIAFAIPIDTAKRELITLEKG
jgi:S1-C subfamily serine protease